jgi:hypothetical protein
MDRNVTLDPLERARAAAKPGVGEIMSITTGKTYDTKLVIEGRRYEILGRIRNRIEDGWAEGRPRVVCSTCLVPVSLLSRQNKTFFFRHKTEDGSCPAVTRGDLTNEQVRALKYAGAAESEAHKRLKQRLLRSIAADSRFSEAGVERTWRGIVIPGRYRRPDVSARLVGRWLAFEGQLSTTFLSVVAGRRVFYKSEGGLLVWIMSHFDPDHRRLTHDDILFSNNSNVFVVDDVTTRLSEAERRFMVRCQYRVPNSRNDQGRAVWATRIVGFDELTLDFDQQRVFLIDVEGEERSHSLRQKAENEAAQLLDAGRLRGRFMAYMTLPLDERPDYETQLETWAGFVQDFRRFGIALRSERHMGHGFPQLIKALESVRVGSPLGWKFESLVQIAHLLANQHKDLLLAFGYAVSVYGRNGQLAEQDKKGLWKSRTQQVREAMKAGDPEYAPNMTWEALVRFLFPEVGARFASKASTVKAGSVNQ